MSGKTGVKKCPECGGEMEKGYLFSDGTPVWWNKRKPGVFRRGSEKVLGPSLWFANAPACRCLKCELIILYYGREGIGDE